MNRNRRGQRGSVGEPLVLDRGKHPCWSRATIFRGDSTWKVATHTGNLSFVESEPDTSPLSRAGANGGVGYMRSGLRVRSSQGMRQCVLIALLASLCAPMIPTWRPSGPHEQGKDLSAPFPCQHRACGCRSAAQCWKKCCCFNHSQKVAWAARNGVRLPALVRKPAAALATQPSIHRVDASTLCAAPGLSQGRLHAVLGSSSKVVSRQIAKTSKPGGPDKVASGEARRGEFVIGWVEASCRGENTLGLSFPPMLPVVAWDWRPMMYESCWDRPSSTRLDGCELMPPLPPPRIAGA